MNSQPFGLNAPQTDPYAHESVHMFSIHRECECSRLFTYLGGRCFPIRPVLQIVGDFCRNKLKKATNPISFEFPDGRIL
jgi:hypothetical protein